MKLVALKPLRYPKGTFNGKRYAVGETFEAKEKHGRALVAAKVAGVAPARAPATRGSSSGFYTTRADLPETGGGQPVDPPEDVAVSAAGAPKEAEGKKRRYTRRDLRAED